MPKLSIIVPIYNAENFIDRCMQSIYAQTLTDFEIILVNDGSTDRSLEICNDYASKDDRICVIDKPNEGSGPTRNKGLQRASGEYIAFPDVDDWFEPDMYNDLYKLAAENNADIAVSGVNHYYKDKNGGLYLHHQSICKHVNFKTTQECRSGVMQLFPTTTIFDSPWNKLYKRNVAAENNITFKKLRRCQDAVFNIDFYNAAQRVVSTDKIYYNYIENTQSEVWRKFPKDYIDINIYYYTHLINVMKSWGVYSGNTAKHYDSSFILSIYNTLGMCENPNWEMNRRQKREYVTKIMNRREVTDFAAAADVRPDVEGIKDILVNKQISKFFRNIRKNKIISALRNNKIVFGLYKKIRR